MRFIILGHNRIPHHPYRMDSRPYRPPEIHKREEMTIPFAQIKPKYHPDPHRCIPEDPRIQTTINTLNLSLHPEGGYFRETNRDLRQVTNPFARSTDQDESRSASSSILYYLTPQRPLGFFHRNKGQTVHVWQRGRGRYVIIHEKSPAQARVETFIVGPDVEAGERLQWVVAGDQFKASFLLPDGPAGETAGLLITEVVIPGFDFADHEFLHKDQMEELLTAEQVEELRWMVRDCADGEHQNPSIL